MTVGFFEGGVGRFFPVSRIQSFRELERAKDQYITVCLVELDDGTEVRSYKSGLMEALRAVQPIVPAIEGTQLVTLWMPENRPRADWDHRLEPIIGWRVSAYGGVEPVVLDYCPTDFDGLQGALFPDGSVTNYEGRRWESLAEFKSCHFDEEEERRADAGRQSA